MFESLLSLLPLVVSAASPYITEGVKALVGKVGKSIPTVLKPVLNVVFGSVLSGIFGGDPVSGGAAGLAGSVGFRVGKTS
jgi:hypothetical protein